MRQIGAVTPTPSHYRRYLHLAGASAALALTGFLRGADSPAQGVPAAADSSPIASEQADVGREEAVRLSEVEVTTTRASAIT